MTMSFDQQTILRVWLKATPIQGNDPYIFRKDACGAWIKYSDYGDRFSKYGWEVDHISPGGPNILSNLRPLHWRNNVAKSDGRLSCAVVSLGNQNIGV